MPDPFRLSVSKTKTFLDCKQRFQYTYIQKLPRKEWDFHILGKFCHKVLEDFHKAYIKDNSTQSLNFEIGKAYKGALQEYGSRMTPEMKKECRDIVDQYLRIVSNDKMNNLSANVLDAEKNFELPINENLLLLGQIDRIQLDADNVLHLADYKTAKDKKYLKNDWFQLMTYGYVMLNENPSLERIRCSYIMLRHNFEYITKEFTAEELWKVKDKYLEYARQMIEEKSFPTNPSILCKWCDFLDVCSDGKELINKISPPMIYGETSW